MLAGACHCGTVRFRVDASITELTTRTTARFA